jgi:hypothetical protein
MGKTNGWLQPSRQTLEYIEHFVKLQRQIDDALGGVAGRMMLDYSNSILDRLQESTRTQSAIDMVGLFSDPQTDGGVLQDWIDDNRDSLTVEDLKAIVMAAMVQGIGQSMSGLTTKRQVVNATKQKKIQELWADYKSKGRSKNAAADRIAREVGQTPLTVRRKLRGL